jgi:chromosomal replication initiation ATPase DnaA
MLKPDIACPAVSGNDRRRRYPQDWPRPLPATVRWIIEDVSDETGITIADILGRGLTRKATLARQECMRRVRWGILVDHLPPSYQRIGLWFDRDHTTVMWACAK